MDVYEGYPPHKLIPPSDLAAGISLRSKAPTLPRKEPIAPRSRPVDPFPSCDVLVPRAADPQPTVTRLQGPRGQRQLVNCPVATAEYLAREHQKDSHFLPQHMVPP